MPAYVLVEIEILDPEAYARYMPLAPPAVAAHGGRYLARGGKTDLLEGDAAPARIAIIEFPSIERAREWWESAQYKAAREVRRNAARARMVAVQGV
jgi:uncharacterized protein (DUF1330 family)